MSEVVGPRKDVRDVERARYDVGCVCAGGFRRLLLACDAHGAQLEFAGEQGGNAGREAVVGGGACALSDTVANGYKPVTHLRCEAECHHQTTTERLHLCRGQCRRVEDRRAVLAVE